MKTTQEWQPIETAPKDGAEILSTNGDWVKVLSYSYGSWSVEHCGGYNCCSAEYEPTHWRYLPKPPKQKEE